MMIYQAGSEADLSGWEMDMHLGTLPALCLSLQLHGCPHICWRVDVPDLVPHALQTPV